MEVGGKLHRLIGDNFYNMIHDSLESLDWFDEDRRHKPIRMIPEPVGAEETVVPNLIAVSEEDIVSSEVEIGSDLAEHRLLYYIDVYAESRSLGIDLSGDIKDIIEGRYHSIGRVRPTFDVYDLRQASPSFLLTCAVEDVSIDRSRYYSKPFEKHWYVVTCDLVYSYANDTWDY